MSRGEWANGRPARVRNYFSGWILGAVISVFEFHWNSTKRTIQLQCHYGNIVSFTVREYLK